MLKIKISNNNEDKVSEIIPDYSGGKYSFDYSFSPETKDYNEKLLHYPTKSANLF